MMCIQSRKRKLVSPFSSFLSNSFLLFSLHFPLDLNCQSNCKRKKITHSGDPTSGASTSSAPPRGRDYEGGEEQREGNNYEVFLSFRGKDNRKSFTDYLYTSLVDAGIHVFRDNNELRVGEEFGSELLRSITQSKISIPITSEGYASSKWCLRELAHMLKCKKDLGQIVLPIFYKVSPSQVRYLTGRFGDAINAHKKNLGEMTAKEWEEALKEVTFLNGWESEKTHDGYEGTLVKTVVRKVMSELKRLFLLNVPKELVGIDDRVDHIMGFIGAEFNDTRIIGIHGMGGIGKTTLAKVLYNKLSSHYEYRSFRADIRETCKSNGIVCVQKKLISDINGDSSDVSNVDDGISVLKYRFTNKKVLILLDDVDDDTHLNALVEDGSWFKAGSIVIITTRDKSILDKARVSHAYQLNGLLFNQSLVLFSRHAFRKDYPPSDYEVISRDVVSTCGGLPLALEVIGSFLCGKTKEAWIATSKKLEKVPHMKVKEKLMISYDALDPGDKQIFLDIACFLIGSSRQISTYMWDACDFYPGKGIEVLSLMSLITIDKGGKLKMHDQLRDLGREIVYLENEKKPEKRSRLWDYEEAKDVLVSNKGTSRIEALCLPEYDYWQGSYTADDFKKLNNLRFLRVNDVRLTGDFQNLLPRLMWLELKFFRRDFELINFHPKELIVLDLTYSKISEDWGGWSPLKMATKLKVLNLTGCNLRTTPDLSSFKSLEILILEYCRNLEEIHPSIEDIKALVSLNVKSCWKLKELPLGVGRMEELRELLVDATPIKEIPISRGCLTKLETLSIAQCKAIDQLPECLGSLESLTQLYLSGIGIEELPETIGSLKQLKILDASYCMSLARVPSSIGSLVSLQRLLLSECHSLREIPNSIGKLASLTELHLESTAIEELPEAIGSLKKLKTLDASRCASLAYIPSSIGHLASLSLLGLKGCHKLTQLPDSIGSLVSLQRLLLSECHSLRAIPNSIGKLASLIELHLESTAIEELPEAIGSLKKLKTLDASRCASLAYIPSSIGHLASLSLLGLERCHNLTQLPGSIGSLVSLQRLLLSECHSLREIPNSIGKLASLTELQLESTAIEELPEAIGSLKKIKTLDASRCASLAYIPSSIGHLASLSLLGLKGCQKLTQLPDSIGSLVSLQRLLLSECHSLRAIPNSIGKLASLIELHLESTAIEELPEATGSLKKLETLDASRCASLAYIPSSIGHLASLSLLGLERCHNLTQLPGSIGSLVSLQRLLLSECHSLREIPNSIGKLASLTELQLESTAIEELPEAIGSLKKLKTLNVSYCASLARVPSSIGHLASLSLLNLTGCDKLTSLPDSIGSLVSLQCLLLSKCHLREILDSIGKLSSLIELHLKSTPIMELPKSIENMQNLRITYVTELLDDSGILAKLQELRASGRKDPEGLPKNTGELFSPDDLDSDKLQKPSELLSRVLALERPRTPPAYNSAMDYQTADSEHVLKRSRSFGISDEDSESMADGKPRIADESGDKSRIWKLTEINEPLQCRSIRLPHNLMATRVSRLIYANSGRAILAISSKGVHGLWNWPKNDQNLTGSVTISVELRLWRLPRQNWMTNDTSDTNPEDAAPCFALSKNDSYLISALRGQIHLFNLLNCKTMTTFMPPPPAATFVAFYPQDNNIIAIGMEDSSILIYNVRVDAVKKKLKGHQERITGLAFSSVLNVLVSSGADSQLCVWRTDGWEKQASKVLHMPTGRATAPLADTRVQFHLAQIHLLVVHERRIAIYEAPILECLTQWVTREASSPITHATYSCDGQSIYTSFEDGSIGVLAASTLRFRCRINAVAYIPPNPSLRVYPLVIAAHPSKPNQFALGLTDGSVFVLEPSESEGEWGTTPVENGAGPSTTSGATASDQPRR